MIEQIEEQWDNATELDDLERPDYSYLDNYDTMPLWSEILPGLWQGGTEDTEDLAYQTYQNTVPTALVTQKAFDTAITLYASAMPADWFVKEIRLGIYDGDMKDFSPEDLFELVKTAHTDWKAGKRVLIRCQAGWNRSGLVMALVLMREGYTAQAAIELIRERRSSSALCNSYFEEYLLSEARENWLGDSYGS